MSSSHTAPGEGLCELEKAELRQCQGEELRRQTVIRCNAFQARLEETLQAYRSQRAWQVMLFLRKAYTHIFRGGWRGWLELFLFLLKSPVRGMPDLEYYELTFPDIKDYLPSVLEEPLEQTKVARGANPDSNYDLVVFPVFEFDYRFQRPQQLAAQFAANGHRVFWISPSRRLPETSPALYEALRLRDNLWEIRLRAPVPDIYGGIFDPDSVERVHACLRELYRDWGIAENCVVLQLPFWRRIGLRLRDSFGAQIVFDCMDAWDSFPHIGEFNRSEQPELIRGADLVVVTGAGLHERCVRQGLEPTLVRNGVDFEFFSKPGRHEVLANVRKPVIGYFGAIADWFDFELLRQVAIARPQYSFVLVGALGLERKVLSESVRRLRTLPNVFFLGHKPYSEMPSFLHAFDVCIIPFVLNRVTEATDPVKMYEYFSQGKPIVATHMSELAQCSDLLHLAAGPVEFAAKLDLALAENDPDIVRRRVDFARENTWVHRYEVIDSAVRRRFTRLSILVVTYNSAQYVSLCLDSIRRNTRHPSYEVVVIDNCSTDRTPDLLRTYAAQDERIRLTCLSENLGFAAANNMAALQASGDHLIFLNADTVVTPGWTERLLRSCRRDDSVGMVLPVTNCAGNEAKIDVDYTDQPSMERFALQLAREKFRTTLELEVGPLFCALVPRRVWETAGELDTRFGVGMFEDDDFSLRIRRAGFRIITAEDCFVHHFGQGSFSQLAPEVYERIFEENRRYFEEKWGAPWQPHKYRAGVRSGERRWIPAEFGGRS